jgi:WD40 repeat protein
MDTPDNYYAILGVPIDTDSETLKRAYRQLARRYHPDLAGPEGAVQMKRINRAYDVLSDPEKRQQYDAIISGIIDLRKGMARPRPMERRFSPAEDIEFDGLSIFSTKGPFHPGPKIRTTLGVVSALSSVPSPDGLHIAAGSLDGKGIFWRVGNKATLISFAANPSYTIESLRELRFSAAGGLLAGWGRLGLHVWDANDGTLLWSYAFAQRAVSAHYSLDTVLKENPGGVHEVWLALPLLRDDPRAPRSQGVRATDVVYHTLGDPPDKLSDPIACAEDDVEKRQFWAIRLRTLAQDIHTLLTLSCAHVPGEQGEMALIRRWNLYARTRTRFGTRTRPQITNSILVGTCANCTPPYAVTPDAQTLTFVYAGKSIRIHDTIAGTYSEVASGTMGASSRVAISPGGQWLAVAREDSEVNEGVIDLWSVNTAQIVQRLYHPWQISALHFAEQRLVVALTDGTIQIWE